MCKSKLLQLLRTAANVAICCALFEALSQKESKNMSQTALLLSVYHWRGPVLVKWGPYKTHSRPLDPFARSSGESTVMLLLMGVTML
jgi:hypothetical protein